MERAIIKLATIGAVFVDTFQKEVRVATHTMSDGRAINIFPRQVFRNRKYIEEAEQNEPYYRMKLVERNSASGDLFVIETIRQPVV